ncbi:uncharacterized protein LOC111684870 [Lucilia cuprina]|uniref:uncharacterized protein LOC111684870 n=1 Tax=Lucilia cuprina TaxID=7375 RepID=UPI001F06CCCD|nr:uncharacterized protein LOC111684870 [Lucilia cuprina]
MKLKPRSAIIVVVFLILNSNAKVLNVNASAQNFTYIYRNYLRNMINIVDHNEEACENFFQHACGNFENFQKGIISENQSEERQDIWESDQDIEPFLYNKQDYYSFFETHKKYFNTLPGILVRNLYNLCKKSQNNPNEKRKMWLRMINDISFLKHDHDLLRKWPFLEYQWQKYRQQLDLNWPALAAEFSAHGMNTFFKIYFAEKAIYVTPNDDLQCLDYNDFKQSLLPLLGRRKDQIADIIGGELWLLCRQLKGEVAISGEIDDISNLLLDETMSEFFQRLFPRLNFTELDIENARKIMISTDKLSEIMSLLRYTNPRIIYNFILWQSYQQIAIIEDCFPLAEEFDSLLQVEYWNWYAFNMHFRREVAMASYLFHTTRFQKHYRETIMSSSVERLFQHRSERKDLNIERSIKKYVKQYLNMETYTTIYKSEFFTNEKPAFYSYLLELRRLKLRFEFLNPYKDTDDLQFFQEFINFSILLVYRPRLHYFASYDREMWQNSKLLENSDGFYSAIDCLSHQTSLNAEDFDIYQELSMDQINDIFNFYSVFIQSLADYKFWLESENFAIAEDFILEYFKLDSMRVMFYAVAQLFCGRNDATYSALINRSYMNMPEFQEAFQCKSINAMNPITKCMINQCL